MKQLIWTDDKGWKHRMLVKDTDGMKEARFGIKQDPPMISDDDWNGLRREVHNYMVENSLYAFQDYVHNQVAAMGLLNVIKRFIVTQFKLK